MKLNSTTDDLLVNTVFRIPDDIRGDDSLDNEEELASLGFSECGKYYTIKPRGQQWPSILPLGFTEATQNDHMTSQLSYGTGELTRKRKVEVGSHENKRRNTMAVTLPSGAQRDNTIIKQEDTHTASTMIKPIYSRQSIELHTSIKTGDTYKHDSIRLVSFPSNVDLRNKSTLVQWPASQEEKIRIILNNVSQNFYDSESTTKFCDALVIDRDPRSLVPTNELDNRSSRPLMPKHDLLRRERARCRCGRTISSIGHSCSRTLADDHLSIVFNQHKRQDISTMARFLLSKSDDIPKKKLFTV